MKKNVGYVDRLVRIILALTIAVFYFNGAVAGVVGLVWLIVAFILILTSMTSFCPMYALFGFKTRSTGRAE